MSGIYGTQSCGDLRVIYELEDQREHFDHQFMGGSQNMYLPEGKDRALLIDTGRGAGNLRARRPVRSGRFDFTLILPYIRQNYHTVTPASLAETFHFSETYLSKRYKQARRQNARH